MNPVQPQLPRSVLILFWMSSIFTLLSSRMIAGSWLHGSSLSSLVIEFAGWKKKKKFRGKPIVVYGAGEAGRQLASALLQSPRFVPVAYVDDDPMLQGQSISGLKVYAPHELEPLVKSNHIVEVLLAIPSAGRHRRRQIIRFLEPLDIHVRSIPSMDELAQGLVTVEDIREVEIADILGRESVPADNDLLTRSICGNNILITGAGGSIGSELCRQVFKYQPARLVLLDHSEFSLYTLHSEFEDAVARAESKIEIIPVIGSVLDGQLMDRVLKIHQVDTIYHAAAYKHVPLVEANGYQGFINNVLGTFQLARSAINAGVNRFVLISTDKAVRPTNIMGASKRLAELLLQAFSDLNEIDIPGLNNLFQKASEKETVSNNTLFTMVRFGNVLDSSGSVIPKFRQQIRDGGPVTVTHRNVTRFFMTIPEAAELVLQANALSEGGDVFILDMGQPVKIDDLARKLIHLSGLTLKEESNPDGDIEICYTGIRPGEKLYEELLIDNSALPTSHPKIWRANERVLSWQDLRVLLNDLNCSFNANNKEELVKLLSCPEIGYAPSLNQQDDS